MSATGGGAIRETDLSAPIRAYLEDRGYAVKTEVEHCDLVAIRGEEPALIVELKTTLNLALFLQASERLALTDCVYVAFPAAAPIWRRHFRRVRTLCRRLGIGIITLDGAALRVNVRLDPRPYRPRGSPARRGRLLREFEHRVGDANEAGATRTPIMTAYRQDALRCVAALAEGPGSVSDVRVAAGVPRAGRILQQDVYGWFARVRRGCYRLSAQGMEASRHYAGEIASLAGAARPGRST